MSGDLRIEHVTDLVGVDGRGASDVATLFLALWSELDAIYGPNPGTEFRPSDMDRAGCAVFLAYSQDQALGCVAIQPWPESETFELKRMYVTPSARGTDAADRLLQAAEDAARTRSATEIRLETGTSQLRAIAFYRRNGYRRCACWGVHADDPASRCFVKSLS